MLVPIPAATFWKLQDASHAVSQALLSNDDTEGSRAAKVQAPQIVHGPDHEVASLPGSGAAAERDS